MPWYCFEDKEGRLRSCWQRPLCNYEFECDAGSGDNASFLASHHLMDKHDAYDEDLLIAEPASKVACTSRGLTQ